MCCRLGVTLLGPVFLLGLILGIGACADSDSNSSSEGADTPQHAVEAYYQAIVAGDQNEYLDVLDTPLRSDPSNVLLFQKLSFSILGIGATVSAQDISIKDLTATEVTREADFASVGVTGRLRYSGIETPLSRVELVHRVAGRWFVSRADQRHATEPWVSIVLDAAEPTAGQADLGVKLTRSVEILKERIARLKTSALAVKQTGPLTIQIDAKGVPAVDLQRLARTGLFERAIGAAVVSELPADMAALLAKPLQTLCATPPTSVRTESGYELRCSLTKEALGLNQVRSTLLAMVDGQKLDDAARTVLLDAQRTTLKSVVDEGQLVVSGFTGKDDADAAVVLFATGPLPAQLTANTLAVH